MNRHLPLLILLTAFPPLSTDMYLGAIPILQKQWSQPLNIVNLTLLCFFITYCFCLLVYGPISDRFGRRPLLLVGVSIYILGSILSACSTGIVFLIVARIIQAAGGAAASALSLAMCKDLFEEKAREKILAHIAIIVAVAPMAAPVIGGWIIGLTSWRIVFVFQITMGLIALFGVIRMPETLKSITISSPKKILMSYVVLSRNKSYILHVIMLSVIIIPFFSFIGGSADIYIRQFHLSEHLFGYLFALNAFSLMLGPFIGSKLVKYIGSNKIITLGIIGVILGGLLMYLLRNIGFWGITLPMFIISFFIGLSRPSATNKALGQVEGGAGSASAFLVFFGYILGALGMWLISFNYVNKVQVLATFSIFAGVISLIIWAVIQRYSGNVHKVEKDLAINSEILFED